FRQFGMASASPGRSGAHARQYVIQGLRLSPRSHEPDNAHLFAQPRTRRISQLNGFNFSTGSSISPLRAAAILPKIFMAFRELWGARPPAVSPPRRGGSLRRHEALQLFMPVERDV